MIRTTHRMSMMVLLVGTMLAAMPAGAAHVVSTWNCGSGDWDDGLLWSSNPLWPNNGNGGNTFDAVINCGTVTLTLDPVDPGVVVEELSLGGGTLLGASDLTANVAITCDGSYVGGTGLLQTNGTLTISGSWGNRFAERTISSPDTVWSGTGDVLMYNGATFNNTGTFESQGYGKFEHRTGARGVFNNLGTFTKSVGTHVTRFDEVSFNNSGTVEVQTGTLSLAGGGTSSGTFVVSPGARLEFRNRLYTIDNPAGLPSSRVTIYGAYLSISGDNTFDELQIKSGGLHGSGTTRIAAGGNLELTGEGWGYLLLGRRLENEGVIRWHQRRFEMGDGAVIDNLAAGVFEVQGSDYMKNYFLSSPNGLFNNQGTFTKSGSIGATKIYTEFNNSGTVEVQTGTLMLGGGGTSSGAFAVSPGARLEFRNNVEVQGPAQEMTYTIDNPVGLPSSRVTIDGALLSISGDNTFDELQIKSGGLGGSGTTRIAAGGTLDFSGDGILNSHHLSIRRLENEGVIHWHKNSFRMSEGAVIDNLAAGVFDVQADVDMVHFMGAPTAFHNSGTFRKTAGTGTTSIDIEFNNSGTVEVQTGTLSLAGGGISSGTFAVSPGATLKFADSTHTLDTGSTLNNDGSLEVSGTTATINGTVSQLAGNTLASGTWIVRADSVLDVVSGSNILVNQATVKLDGTNSHFAKINSLADNQGSFNLLGGRSFSTAGNLDNSGTLHVGTGSTLAVSGNYQQTTAGTFAVDLVGADHDEMTVAADASLAGHLDLRFSGPAMFSSDPMFTPGIYTLMTYDSHTNIFDTVTDLGVYVTGDGLDYGDHQLTLTIDHSLLIGDLDLDGDVDFFDYIATSNNFGETEGMRFQDGDMDGDGDVDFFDYITVSNHFGDSLPAITGVAGAADVPEPSTLVLLTIGALGLLTYAWQRRRH